MRNVLDIRRRRTKAMLAVVGAAALGYACRGGTIRQMPRIDPASEIAPAAWRSDLAATRDVLAKRHKDAFHFQSRRAFDSTATELDHDLGALSSARAFVRLRQLVASIGDGHTRLHGYPASFGRIAARFYWYDDGIRIVGVDSARPGLLGATIDAVNDVPIAVVIDSLARQVPHDNRAGLLADLPELLAIPELLVGSGIGADGRSIKLRGRGARGDAFEVVLPREDGNVAWLPARPSAQAAARSALPFRARLYSVEHTLVIDYDQCSFEREFRLFADSVLKVIDSAKVDRVLVDLRRNGGGASWIIDPLLDGLKKRDRINRRGGLYVAIGRGTYSSAMQNALTFRDRTNAILIGEPTGGRPNSFGEVYWATLPNSRLVLQYSTKYYRKERRGDPEAVEPAIRIPVRYADEAARRDAVLSAVLEGRAP